VTNGNDEDHTKTSTGNAQVLQFGGNNTSSNPPFLFIKWKTVVKSKTWIARDVWNRQSSGDPFGYDAAYRRSVMQTHLGKGANALYPDGSVRFLQADRVANLAEATY